MERCIKIGLGNTYGEVIAIKREDGEAVLVLEDWSGFDQIDISQELYEALKKEFGEEGLR